MRWRKLVIPIVIAIVAITTPVLPENVEGDPEPPAKFIMFGGSANYAPFEWREDEAAMGFNIELEDAIARQGRAAARHRLMEWEDAMAALENREIDVLPMFASDERARRFRFTEPFYYLTHGIFGRIDGPVVAQPEDLGGRRVAVVDNGYADSQFRRLGIAAEMQSVDTIRTALQKLVDGEVEFAILARHPARRIASDLSLPVTQLSRPFWPRRYVFAVHRDAAALHEWLQHNLGMVQASGTYNDIYERWENQLEWTQPTLGEFLKRYAWLMAALLTIIALVLTWSSALRRKVRQRTSELSDELARRREAEDEIRYRAYHDTLTDLPNRNCFIRDLDTLCGRYQHDLVSVVVISLNGVEDVVLSFGYSVGEAMVQSFAGRLREFGFDACSHLGSGVFAAASRGSLAADETIKAITDPLELHDMEIDPRLSVGLAAANSTELHAEELLRRARTALSAAIENRRPWQEYSAAIEPDPQSITLLRDYWRFGVRDFVAWLQPQVDLRSGGIIGIGPDPSCNGMDGLACNGNYIGVSTPQTAI